MKATQALNVIYYSLLIFILIYVIFTIVDFKRFLPNSQEVYHDVDVLDDSDRNKKRKKKFKYDQPEKIDIKPGQTKTNSENNIDFESFKQIVATKEFIRLFKKSLVESYSEKKIIYTKLLMKAKSKISKKKNLFEVDSNHTRTEKEISEIEDVLKTLDLRVKTVSEQSIKRDFDDIIHDSSNGFASLVGREEIKNQIAKRIYTFAKNPLVFIKGFQNMAIYGKSGVGKTKLAETIGWIYAKTGILVRRKFNKVSKQEFTSPYIDESASLTRGMVMSCLEGALFIDEAYGLTPSKSSLFGNISGSHKEEAITELVNALDTYRGLGIVMVGGYEDKMERDFMTSNEGMKRRFPTVIRLEDYNGEQLTNLLIDFMTDISPKMEIDQKDANYLYSVVEALNKKGVFDRQAGDMQNLADEIIHTLYGSYFNWGSSHENNCLIIKDGVNMFLKNKNKHEHID